MRQPVFIENLNAARLLQAVFLKLFFKTGPLVVNGELFILYEVSRPAQVLVASLRALRYPVAIRVLDYDFFDDVRQPGRPRPIDESYTHAPPHLVEAVERNPEYARGVRLESKKPSHERYIGAYLSKRIYLELSGAVRSVLVTEWYSKIKLGERHLNPALFIERTWLFSPLSEYAGGKGVKLHPLPKRPTFWKDTIKSCRELLRYVVYGLRNIPRVDTPSGQKRPPRIAVEMYFNGIGQSKIVNTDLFWYRRPSLPPHQVAGYFVHAQDQPVGNRLERLKRLGIEGIDRSQFLQLVYGVQPKASFSKSISSRGDQFPKTGDRIFERSLRTAIRDFYSEYAKWIRFFSATGTRLHVSTTDHFPESEALHAAIEDIGGISVSIQRSIECEPRVFRRSVVDVHLSFSKTGAESERLSGSTVRQFVTAGYLFDDAFPEAREKALEFVSQLRSRGSSFILCFLDEATSIFMDRKILGGGRQTQSDYRFLCDRLSDDPTFGLVLKPKRPETLPERLGPVWSRLKGFIDSGRCILLSGQGIDERYLPCVGACAADLAVGLLDGATAGLECALAGVKTVLIGHGADRDIFRRLPKGRVVFDTWEELWPAIEQLRAHPADSLIGNWEPILEEFVSMRDGRASERMGKYILSLHQALAAGQSREDAMEHAKQLYTRTWGEGMITPIGAPLPKDCLANAGVEWAEAGSR